MPGSFPRRVLLVDDEIMLLEGLARAFRRFPQWQVFTACGGELGLALLARQPVEAIIADMRMPGMSGGQFLSEVGRRYPSISRVMLTGSMSGEIAPTEYPVFYKPCRIEFLIAAIAGEAPPR